MSAAYEAGCRCFLCEHLPDTPLPADALIYLSDDTRRDLSYLAAEYYVHPARHLSVVGITGTKGKTTVAMMCHHIATKTGIPSGYIGTCGVRYGNVVRRTGNTTPGPLELQQYLHEMREAGITTVFLEVSSQALWQKRVEGIPFTAVAMTNLSPDHIGGAEHPDFDHYVAAKKRLLTDFSAPVALLNADDARVAAMKNDITATTLLCGHGTGADVQATDIRQAVENGHLGVRFTYHDQTGASPVFLPLPGDYNVSNALFALSLTGLLGIPTEDAIAALSDVTIPGRFEVLTVKGATVVIDYAHNGASLRAVLTTLRSYAPARLLCLVGSVGERTQCRRAELGAAASELADYTYLTADDPGLESVVHICREIAAAFPPDGNYRIIPDRAMAIRDALADLQAGDILLLAGKGDEQVQKIGGKLVPHSDRAVVEACLDSQSVTA
jgi:UDP-N-acetylmuramoyl-L-alanyl-D-glutamate--2,6-diaminopimelate ligase